MILKDIHISGFGKYTHEDLSFSEGVNVIYGENGSGKSTLHAYLKSMLFGMERGRGRAAHTDSYSRCYPWSSQAPYGGSLTFSTEEGEFLLERCLDAKNRTLAVRRASTGQLAAASQEELDKLLSGLTEEAYRNTISIEQLKAATDGSLSEELKNHLSSLALSGTSTLDVSHTMAALKEQKKALQKTLNKEAEKQYRTLFHEICETEDRLKTMDSQPEELTHQIKELQVKLQKEQDESSRLEQLAGEQEQALEDHSLSGIRDIEIYQDRIQDAFAAHRLAAEENSRRQKRSLLVRDVLSGVFACLIFLLLGFGTLFYEQLPFVNTPFPLPRMPFLILFFISAGISFLVTVILFIRSKKDDSDSEAMAAETEQFLIQEFKTHLGTSEVNEDNRKALEDKLAEYDLLKRSLADTKARAAASLKATVALQEQLRTAGEEMARCQKQAWEFEQAVSRLSDLEDQKTALGRTLEANCLTEEKINAITLAEDTISSLSAKLHETFSPVLNSRVSEILCAITDGVYDKLMIDEDLKVTVRNGGRTIPLEALSRGTIEQVYLALRISAVEILYPGISLPILLDDTFAYYDDARLHNTLKWLSENYSGQVLLFTCHKREAAFLSRLGVPYHLVALS